MCHLKADNKMKKYLLIILTSAILSACNNNHQSELIGKWEEYYGVGQVTDVNYKDVFIITVNNENKIELRCETHPNYSFEKKLFDEVELSFEIHNDNYVLPMVLKFQESNYSILEGYRINIHGEKRNVKWKKIK